MSAVKVSFCCSLAFCSRLFSAARSGTVGFNNSRDIGTVVLMARPIKSSAGLYPHASGVAR